MLGCVHVGGGCVGEEVEREINSVCFFERVVTSRLLSSSQGQKAGAGLRFQLRDPSSRKDKRGCAPNMGVSGNREICGGPGGFYRTPWRNTNYKAQLYDPQLGEQHAYPPDFSRQTFPNLQR